MINILRIQGNYADEFDIEAVHEISKEEAEFLLATEGACFNTEEEIYFGSNECVSLGDLSITMDTLTDDEYNAVKRALGCGSTLSFGLINLSDVIQEAMNP